MEQVNFRATQLTEDDWVSMNAVLILGFLSLGLAIANLFTARVPLAIPVILADVALLVWAWSRTA